MQKKRKTKQKKNLIILFLFLFSFLILLLFYINQNKNYSRIEKVIRDIGVNLESIFIPKVTVYNQEVIDGINKELLNENEELKQMLNLNSDKYLYINATVIKRELDWYQEITIDKGEKDGIKLDMAVISNQGLIGRISKTGYSSSVVKLLTSSSKNMKIAVDIKNDTETIHGIIDDYLEKETLIQINNVSKNTKVNINDKVYTNGLGGIYPSGIYIGKVVEVTEDSFSLNKILKVKPDISYDKLRYVSVIGGEY